MQATDATRVLQRELKEADTDKNGLIDLQEFQSYFQRMAIYQQNEARTQRLKSSRKNMPSGELQIYGLISKKTLPPCSTAAQSSAPLISSLA